MHTPHGYRLAAFLLALWAVSALPAAGQTAAPVIDLAQGGNAGQGSSPRQLTVLRRGRVIFEASVPGSGTEVWTSDGTEVGTRMLADLCPGPCPSFPEILGTVSPGGTASFAVWTASLRGQPDRLWQTDGTREGTFLVADDGGPLTVFRKVFEEPDEIGYHPLDHALLGGALYVQACGAIHGCGLWRTDGTPAGTRLAVPGSKLGGAAIGTLAAGGGRVFFFTDAPAGGGNPALWRTDGTAAGTLLLGSFPSAPRALTAASAKAFFLAPARDGNEEELWVSDGTRPGTRPLTHFAPVSPFSPTLSPLFAAGAHVDFAADDGGHGREIWQSDGTVAGTRRITDFADPEPFGVQGLDASLLEVNGRVLIQARTGGADWKLWVSNGDPASVALLHGCLGGCQTDVPGRGLLAVVGGSGGRALFLAADAAHGLELWGTDGTAAGTHLLRDLCPGSCSSQIGATGLLPGGLAFVDDTSDNAPSQLWSSDGTPAGTRPLTHFGTGTGAGFANPVAAGPSIFFSAANADGEELWVIEGGAARQVANLAPDAPSSFPQALTPLGGGLVFQATVDGVTRLFATASATGTVQLLSPVHPPDVFACRPRCGPATVSAGTWVAFLSEPADVQLGHQLWRTDGTAAGTAQLTNVAPPDHLDLSLAALSGGTVLFFIERHDRRELWRSDGTAAGTVMVAVVPGSALSSPPVGFAATGAEVWFGIHGDDGSARLWRSDGTPAGTRAAVTLPPGLEILPLPVVRAGSRVFFETAETAGSHAVQLWSTDGTAAGTVALTAGPGFGVFEMKEFGGALYFLAFDAAATSGLWRSDGTPEGTVRLHEFALVDDDHLTLVQPSGLTVFGGRLAFAAKGGPEGTELWGSDGTAAGTRLVRDINPAGSSNPGSFAAAGDRVFFSAFDDTHGVELWESDGTEAGTRLVQDIAPEELSSTPDQLTVAGDHLYFTADDGAIGRELWSLPLTGTGGCQASATVLCLGGRYRVEVLWRDPQDHRGSGQAVPLTGAAGDTGAFWFFSPDNDELVVKVLDGTGTNGHVWVFYGALTNVEYTLTVTDTETGLARRYFNPQGQLASVGDVHAFGPLGAKSRNPAPLVFPASPSPGVPLVSVNTANVAKAVCDPAPTALCITGGRFVVTVEWKDFQGHTGHGTAVQLTGDTGAFWFFSASNLELIVKVLDGRPVNGHFWLFYGALSNVEYTVTVTDVQTFTTRTYKNPAGRFASVADVLAF